MEQRESQFDQYEEIDEDTQKGKYLSFHVGRESYGIEIKHVKEIIVMQEITEVPDMPESFIGVINLRGKVISIIDFRKFFKMEAREYDNRTSIIVVEIGEVPVGVVVDTVSEVFDIPEENIDPPPRTHSGISSKYIKGIGKIGNNVRILLNIENILYEEELESVAIV
ncbi:chemotaxis protein CheW [bacterium]|nr:chemotaxis protein CheW [bacterium]